MPTPTAKTQPKFFLRLKGQNEPVESWVATELSRCYQELESRFASLSKSQKSSESGGSSVDYSAAIASLQSSVESLTDAVKLLQETESAVSEEEFQEVKLAVEDLANALTLLTSKVSKLNNIIFNAPIEEQVSAPATIAAYASIEYAFSIDFSIYPVKTKFLASIESAASLSPYFFITAPQVITGENLVVIRGLNISTEELTLPAFSVLLYALI